MIEFVHDDIPMSAHRRSDHRRRSGHGRDDGDGGTGGVGVDDRVAGGDEKSFAIVPIGRNRRLGVAGISMKPNLL